MQLFKNLKHFSAFVFSLSISTNSRIPAEKVPGGAQIRTAGHRISSYAPRSIATAVRAADAASGQ